jgi:YebC/PmpR family DNA-binding regulatory protein
MSGHNKWSTIKHKKAAVDAKRGKIFTKVIKEITVAAKMGGADVNTNPRLRSAVLAARAANMPKDTMDRAVKKGAGDLDGVEYIEGTYEGYGPGGVAFIVEVLTDNRNRTVGDVRFAFSRCNGNMGMDGSVAWMFERKGQISLNFEGKTIDEDAVMMDALDAGAEDVERDGDAFYVTTAMGDLYAVRERLDAKGYTVEEATLARVPATTVACDASMTRQVTRLIDMLEDNDDVQKVFHNAALDEGGLEEG